jgi:hypothetical protein
LGSTSWPLFTQPRGCRKLTNGIFAGAELALLSVRKTRHVEFRAIPDDLIGQRTKFSHQGFPALLASVHLSVAMW